MNYTKAKKNKKSGGFKRSFGNNKPKRSRGSRSKNTSLDPNTLINRVSMVERPTEYVPWRSFQQMPLRDELISNLTQKGFINPTQIQDESLERLVRGGDIVGIANTGTGKTAAFLIPIVEQLLNAEKPFKTLIVLPTRELALQVAKEFRSLSDGLGLHASTYIGGTSINRDIRQLKRSAHLTIGTPGRLNDLVNRGALRLQDHEVLVLDEFDRMLDMGFVTDIKKLIALMNKRRQTMLFSATIDPTQQSLIDELLNDPIELKVSSGTAASEQIDQDIIRVRKGEDKFDLLVNLISDDEFEKVLIFAETKRLCDKVNKKLNNSGVRSDLIHGNKSQHYRSNALDKFKRGNVQVLVATDVAARGIDVSNVTHVINYQMPQSLESYVHRIGRTGRAGKTGKALTFVD